MAEEHNMMNTEKWIDEVLKSDPGFVLPDNFADEIARKAGRKFVWRQYLHEFLVYLAVIGGIVVVAAAIAFLWFHADWKQWLKLLSANAVLVVAANLLLVFVLFADRVLLRYFMYRSSNS